MENLTIEELNNLPLEDKVRLIYKDEDSTDLADDVYEMFLIENSNILETEICVVAKNGVNPDEYNMTQEEFDEFMVSEIVNLINGVIPRLVTSDELDAMPLAKRIRYINYLLISDEGVHDTKMIEMLLVPKYNDILRIIRQKSDMSLTENPGLLIEEVIKELSK